MTERVDKAVEHDCCWWHGPSDGCSCRIVCTDSAHDDAEVYRLVADEEDGDA